MLSLDPCGVERTNKPALEVSVETDRIGITDHLPV